jgi:hypothetical protein
LSRLRRGFARAAEIAEGKYVFFSAERPEKKKIYGIKTAGAISG